MENDKQPIILEVRADKKYAYDSMYNVGSGNEPHPIAANVIAGQNGFKTIESFIAEHMGRTITVDPHTFLITKIELTNMSTMNRLKAVE